MGLATLLGFNFAGDTSGFPTEPICDPRATPATGYRPHFAPIARFAVAHGKTARSEPAGKFPSLHPADASQH